MNQSAAASMPAASSKNTPSRTAPSLRPIAAAPTTGVPHRRYSPTFTGAMPSVEKVERMNAVPTSAAATYRGTSLGATRRITADAARSGES